MQWTDILDIILVAFLIYKLLPLLRSTGTMRVARVIAVILVAAGWFIYKSKKSGKKCIGCPDSCACSSVGCNGGCSGNCHCGDSQN